jgi:hypothetical protein
MSMDNGTGGQEVMPLSTPHMPMDPRTVKSRMFSAERRRFKSEIVTFFGEEIEIRQSTIGRMLDRAEDMSNGNALINVLLNYAYLPGTELPMFDDTDVETLKNQPYGADFEGVMAAFNRITGSVKAETKNSTPTPPDSK